ncbi:MAG: glycosyltransferase family 4 protein, partial [Bacteroidota bacterium]
MIRICTALVEMGYRVTLIGRKLPHSSPLRAEVFQQHRLHCFWNKGKLFYIEYNLRLCLWLFRQSADAICSVDLDTILPGRLVSAIKHIPQVYDAHEYFTETPEVVRRPLMQRIWAIIARCTIPYIPHCYTVGEELARLFSARYAVPFGVVRNVPFYRTHADKASSSTPILLYQGALNEGRGLESLIAAMPQIEAELWLAGEGDLSKQLRSLARSVGATDRIRFLGFVPPRHLPALTLQATIGLNLLENKGLSYYYSLANKAFDYIQAGVPSINMAFPEYTALQQQYATFYLVEDLEQNTLVSAINHLLSDRDHYNQIVK